MGQNDVEVIVPPLSAAAAAGRGRDTGVGLAVQQAEQRVAVHLVPGGDRGALAVQLAHGIEHGREPATTQKGSQGRR